MALIIASDFAEGREFPPEMTGHEVANELRVSATESRSAEVDEFLSTIESPSSFYELLRNMRSAMDRNLLVDPSFYSRSVLNASFGEVVQLDLYDDNFFRDFYGDSELMQIKIRGNLDVVLMGDIGFRFDVSNGNPEWARAKFGDAPFSLKKRAPGKLHGEFVVPALDSKGAIPIDEIRSIFSAGAEESSTYFNAIEWSHEAKSHAMKNTPAGVPPFIGYAAPTKHPLGNKKFVFSFRDREVPTSVTCTTMPDGSLISIVIVQGEK
ncbi:hypothetical protein [Herbaspirillum sp. alder98]|uniref:hypothetical protein n=1 Tax=Herbaspirillum sp. alder98 TaxID=2913096 RepID=UPI001CD84D97|nr:hypothetical protein [Herbaspirillum sp. alder98]MCA1323591.1 hypothetical protein [Herbaspirillum sp. alder98]